MYGNTNYFLQSSKVGTLNTDSFQIETILCFSRRTGLFFYMFYLASKIKAEEISLRASKHITAHIKGYINNVAANAG